MHVMSLRSNILTLGNNESIEKINITRDCPIVDGPDSELQEATVFELPSLNGTGAT